MCSVGLTVAAAFRFVVAVRGHRTGTRRSISSVQFWTTTMREGVVAASVSISNRCPSAETSYCGLGEPDGEIVGPLKWLHRSSDFQFGRRRYRHRKHSLASQAPVEDIAVRMR